MEVGQGGVVEVEGGGEGDFVVDEFEGLDGSGVAEFGRLEFAQGKESRGGGIGEVDGGSGGFEFDADGLVGSQGEDDGEDQGEENVGADFSQARSDEPEGESVQDAEEGEHQYGGEEVHQYGGDGGPEEDGVGRGGPQRKVAADP